MIIELFGAPTTGKTTFARALAAQLRECGHSVEVILSYRPAETVESPSERSQHTPSTSQTMAAVHRITRPALELLASAGQYLGRPELNIGTELLALLPARSVVWSVRLNQYITRLDRSWRRARLSDSIVIFDQGFVQAICSLVLLGRSPDAASTSKALALAPRADLLIKLNAPHDVLIARLDVRRRNQGRLEQWLELDAETNMKSVEIVDTLQEMLDRTGQQTVSAQCLDRASLVASLARITRHIEQTGIAMPRARAC